MVLALTQTGYFAFNSHIYPFHQHLLSAYLGTTLGAENSAVEKKKTGPYFHKTFILVERDIFKNFLFT